MESLINDLDPEHNADEIATLREEIIIVKREEVQKLLSDRKKQRILREERQNRDNQLDSVHDLSEN